MDYQFVATLGGKLLFNVPVSAKDLAPAMEEQRALVGGLLKLLGAKPFSDLEVTGRAFTGKGDVLQLEVQPNPFIEYQIVAQELFDMQHPKPGNNGHEQAFNETRHSFDCALHQAQGDPEDFTDLLRMIGYHCCDHVWTDQGSFILHEDHCVKCGLTRYI